MKFLGTNNIIFIFRFVVAEEKLKDTEGKVTEVQDQVKALKEETKDNVKESKEFDKQIADITKKLNEVDYHEIFIKSIIPDAVLRGSD